MTRGKRFIANILLLSVGMVFSLILLEMGVRVFGLYRFPDDVFIQPHPELGWAHISGKEGHWHVEGRKIPIRINEKGLRDNAYPYEKSEGIFRILVLGDSFTEGFQVPLESTFCKVLENRFAHDYGKGGLPKVEVINAGFAGVGTDYALNFYKKEGVKYAPDVVILAFFGNDIYDNFRSKSMLDNDRKTTEYTRKGVIASLKKALAQHSCAYNYLGLVIPKYMPRLAAWLMNAGLLSSQPIGDGEGVASLHYLVFEKEYGVDFSQAWELTKLLIRKLAREVRETDAKFVVVSIPFREQVYEKYWNKKLALPGMQQRQWNLNKPDELLSPFLVDTGVPFLSLLSTFKDADTDTPLYYTGHDGHWNDAGHELAAETIYTWLRQNEIIPSAVWAP